MAAILSTEMTIVLGPAGTGKTFIASTIAADRLRNNDVRKIILTRPNVPGGRSLGFFPGTIEEKIGPWVVPFTSVIFERMGQGAFDNAFVILDEAQNTTSAEMKMFLTRLGKGCTIVVNGDVAQSDLKGDCGLKTALHLATKHHLPVSLVEFQIDDIVRSDLCAA